jgi:hypothetical protein
MKTTHRSLTGAVLLLALVPWMTVTARADEAEDEATAPPLDSTSLMVPVLNSALSVGCPTHEFVTNG